MIAFLVQLFLVCLAYTGTIQSDQLSFFFGNVKPSGITLFWHVLILLVYPLLLVLLWRAL